MSLQHLLPLTSVVNHMSSSGVGWAAGCDECTGPAVRAALPKRGGLPGDAGAIS